MTTSSLSPAPKLYDMDQAAAYFARPKSTVERWVRAGRLGGYKLGGEWRFTDEDFLDFLNRSRRPAERLAS